MEGLLGKVVLVDFWTYSCINCMRTLPYLKAWYDTYGNRGLVIVGVHTPEFEFEKRTVNVERVIQALLKEAGSEVGGIVSKPAPIISVQTPGNGEWNLRGKWTIKSQFVVPENEGVLELGFNAKNVFLVIEPEENGGKIDVSVDGKVSDDTAEVRSGAPAFREKRDMEKTEPGTAEEEHDRDAVHSNAGGRHRARVPERALAQRDAGDLRGHRVGRAATPIRISATCSKTGPRPPACATA